MGLTFQLLAYRRKVACYFRSEPGIVIADDGNVLAHTKSPSAECGDDFHGKEIVVADECCARTAAIVRERGDHGIDVIQEFHDVQLDTKSGSLRDERAAAPG